MQEKNIKELNTLSFFFSTMGEFESIDWENEFPSSFFAEIKQPQLENNDLTEIPKNVKGFGEASSPVMSEVGRKRRIKKLKPSTGKNFLQYFFMRINI